MNNTHAESFSPPSETDKCQIARFHICLIDSIELRQEKEEAEHVFVGAFVQKIITTKAPRDKGSKTDSQSAAAAIQAKTACRHFSFGRYW